MLGLSYGEGKQREETKLAFVVYSSVFMEHLLNDEDNSHILHPGDPE